MPLKYASIPSEDVIFREKFINNTYVSDNGVTLTNGPTVSNGIVLNGSSQLGETPFSFDDLDVFSIEVVFTPGTVGGTWHPLIVQGLQAASGVMFAQNTNRVMLLIPNSSYETLVADDVLLQVGQMYHAVATFDGTNGLIYVNGNLDTATRAFTKVSSGGNKTTIGASVSGGIYGSWSTLYYQGTIYGLNVYNRVLTAEEVADRFTQLTFKEPTPENSDLWLPLRTHYNTGANEVTPNLGNVNSDQILWGDGSTTITYPTLLENNGASFDGTDYIQINNTPALDISDTTDMTFFFLARLNVLTGNQAFFGKTDGNFANDTGYMLGLLSDNDLSFVCNDGTAVEQTITVNNIINDIGWHSYAIVVDRNDANKVYIYMDKILQNAGGTTITVTGSWAKAVNFVLGALLANTWNITGAMKYPIATNQALTPTQIKWLHDRAFRELNI